MVREIARRFIPNTGANMQEFIDSCSDDELTVVLRYIQAQLKDELARRIQMQDSSNVEQIPDYAGMVNAFHANKDE